MKIIFIININKELIVTLQYLEKIKRVFSRLGKSEKIRGTRTSGKDVPNTSR